MLTAKQKTGESSYSTVQTSTGTTNERDELKVDTSDIPEMTEEDFARSKKGLFYRPNMKKPKFAS